jgi:hypothetical protein
MGFTKLSEIPEQPAKADKSAPTGIPVICLNLIIGGERGVVRRAPLRFAEAPTLLAPVWLIVYIQFMRFGITRSSTEKECYGE